MSWWMWHDKTETTRKFNPELDKSNNKHNSHPT